MATVKSTFALPEGTIDYLREQSEARGVSMGDIVRQAIKLDQQLVEEQARGAQIILENGTDRTKLSILR